MCFKTIASKTNITALLPSPRKDFHSIYNFKQPSTRNTKKTPSYTPHLPHLYTKSKYTQKYDL